MAKQVSRKKQLKNQLRRLNKKSGISGTVTVNEGVQEVVMEVASSVEKKVATVEEFAASLEGIAVDRARTFYESGIQSVKDFEKWTEKELLALKRIGPATIKKLKELGIRFGD